MSGFVLILCSVSWSARDIGKIRSSLWANLKFQYNCPKLRLYLCLHAINISCNLTEWNKYVFSNNFRKIDINIPFTNGQRAMFVDGRLARLKCVATCWWTSQLLLSYYRHRCVLHAYIEPLNTTNVMSLHIILRWNSPWNDKQWGIYCIIFCGESLEHDSYNSCVRE
jgi:hypothetical protein